MVQNKSRAAQKNKFWCDTDLLYYTINKSVDANEATYLRDGGIDLIVKKGVSLVLIDIQRSTTFSSAARKIWVDFLSDPHIKKAAIFGGNVFVRTLASFVIAAVGKKNVKFFSTKKEALSWLHT